MGYFAEDVIKKVELAVKDAEGNPYWVNVKENLKYGDIKTFINLGKEGVVDAVASLDAFLKAAIVDWNLDDGEGNIAPVDEEHINKLGQTDAVTIINAAGAAIAGDPKEANDFLGKSEASSIPVK